jgi:CHAD domain-containing protein
VTPAVPGNHHLDMSYRLRFDQTLDDGLRRVASEQLGDALAGLRDSDGTDPVKAVHEARKSVKKSRAALRLARPALAKDDYRSEDHALRDAGRSLSGARDADVLLETVDALGERFAGRLPAADFADLRERMAEQLAGAREGGGDTAAAAQLLEAAAERVERWPLEAVDWDGALDGATRAYALGRQALAVAERDPDDENLHELRKRVKDLWYHQRLLSDAWPGVMEAQTDETDGLAEDLGDDHDLAVLTDFLRRTGPELGTTTDLDAVAELIARYRAELYADILRVARRVYAEKPAAFRRRLAAYTTAARAEAHAAGAAA